MPRGFGFRRIPGRALRKAQERYPEVRTDLSQDDRHRSVEERLREPYRGFRRRRGRNL